MNKIPFKVNWRLYSAYDVVLLLSVYNVSFLFLWKILDLGPGISFVITILLTLVLLFGLTVLAIKEQAVQEKITKLLKEEEQEKSIKEEYQRVYRLKKKEELLLKSKCLNSHPNKLLIVEPEEDEFELIIHNGSSLSGVHFDYINGTGPNKTSALNPKGQNFKHMVDEDKKE